MVRNMDNMSERSDISIIGLFFHSANVSLLLFRRVEFPVRVRVRVKVRVRFRVRVRVSMEKNNLVQ